MRAPQVSGQGAGDFGFGSVLASIFLIGPGSSARCDGVRKTISTCSSVWRCGVCPRASAWGCWAASSLCACHTGAGGDGYQLAHGLAMVGNCQPAPGLRGPGGVVVARTGRHLAARTGPGRRMALTNYLGAVGAVFVHLLRLWPGLVGMPRSQQVVFVLVVYALQVAFSRWWLARFRLGPMEWVWRSFTYREYPPMRRLAFSVRRSCAAFPRQRGCRAGKVAAIAPQVYQVAVVGAVGVARLPWRINGHTVVPGTDIQHRETRRPGLAEAARVVRRYVGCG